MTKLKNTVISVIFSLLIPYYTHYTLQKDTFWSKNNGKNYDNNNKMSFVVVSKFLNDDDDDVQMLGKIYLELLTTICDH